jgi:hypothetical protein
MENYDYHIVDSRATPIVDNHYKVAIPRIVHQVLAPATLGYKNPRWRYQTAHLQNATTTFSGLDWSDDPQPFVSLEQSVTYRRQSDGAVVYAVASAQYSGMTSVTAPTYTDPPTSVVTDVTNRCIKDFLRSVDSAQSSFEAGQDLGEWKQTLESVHHPLNSLKTSLSNYFLSLSNKKRKFRNKNDLKKVLADTYLEFHFGWQPLVADVSQAIADIGRFRFPAVPVRGRAKSTYSSTATTVAGGYEAPITHTHSYVETSTYETRFKGMLRPRNLGSDGRLSLAQSLQLTPDKWLPTAWDLLPYSWMSDYFINIGEIISGLSAAMSIDLAWGVNTTRHHVDRSYNEVKMPDPYIQEPGYDMIYHVNSAYGGTCQTWFKHVERAPLLLSDLIPRLEFSIPGTKYPFFNMGAILLQKAKPLVPFFR